jgi:hypothetical protein
MDSQCYKEVYFHRYCKTCQHEKVEDTDEPCDECMSEPINLNTHRPVKYEAKETKR